MGEEVLLFGAGAFSNKGQKFSHQGL